MEREEVERAIDELGREVETWSERLGDIYLPLLRAILEGRPLDRQTVLKAVEGFREAREWVDSVVSRLERILEQL